MPACDSNPDSHFFFFPWKGGLKETSGELKVFATQNVSPGTGEYASKNRPAGRTRQASLFITLLICTYYCSETQL